jgi:hypothetical protein
MQTIRRARVIAPAVLLLCVALVAAGCSPGAATTGPSATVPSATGMLVTVETRGGECVKGPCGTAVVLERDGRVHSAAKPPNDLGTVSPDRLAALDALIRRTDFAALKSHRFTGECPTAFDGQEIVFEFGAPGGVQRIATCEVDVDFGLPLFVAVSTALGPFIPLPTT